MGRQKVRMHAAAEHALAALAAQIREARVRKGWTVTRFAEAAGLSRGTVTSIEKGDPAVSIGNVLHAAVIAGVPLFGTGASARELALVRRRSEERLAMLPARVRPQKELSDDELDF